MIAALVILYNPEKKFLENIQSFVHQVDKLYVVDNSNKFDILFHDSLQKKVEYDLLHKGTNIGVAAALNLGINKALIEGFEYLLTMDQDSFVPKKVISQIRNSIKHISNQSWILVAPNLRMGDKLFHPRSNEMVEDVLFVPTSGSIINLKNLDEIGHFFNDLFIDYVDIEFCLRAKQHNYKIYIVPNVLIEHSLGRLEVRRFLFSKVHVTNHDPIRLYYRIRNRLYVVRKYWLTFPVFTIKIIKMIFGDLVKILLYESKKREKLVFLWKGFLDFIKSKYGKYYI